MSAPRCALCAAMTANVVLSDGSAVELRVPLCEACGDILNAARPVGCYVEDNERLAFHVRLRELLGRFFEKEDKARKVRENKRERERRKAVAEGRR